MFRFLSLFASVSLLAAACGSDAGATSSTTVATTAATTLSTNSATTTVPASTAPSSTDATSTTGATTTSTTVAATSTTLLDLDNPLPTLADGRPATFIGVTEDYEAVEVDTASGEILRVIGQTGSPADFTDDQEISPNVIVGAWRTADGSVLALSDCCEPAAGYMMYVADGETLPAEWTERVITDGWTASPSPTGNRFARLGYFIGVFTALPEPMDEVWIDVGQEAANFASGRVAWSRDETALYWIGGGPGQATLNRIDLTSEPVASSPVGVLEFVGGGQWVDGVAMQASGNLVAFVHQTNNGDFVDTDGVVFTTDGDLIATFPVEVGSTFGGYEPTGRFLIYVDREGIVRWQGRGESGVLADGFIHASW